MVKTKRQRIKELERELEATNSQIKRMDYEIADLRNVVDDKDQEILKLELKIDEILTTLNKHDTPPDCTPGKWCAACEFGKEYTVTIGFASHTCHLCNKAGSCVNFIQKEK